MKDKEVHTTTARSTDTEVTVYQLAKPFEDCLWMAFCREHHWAIYTPTRREAHGEASDVELWCEKCGE